MPSFLESSIIQTVVYFDLFNYPLTTLEIWQNLGCKASYGEVYKKLLQLKILKFKNGLWTLNDSNIVERQRRYRFSKHKLDKARKFARYLKWIPCVESVYVCNSLGYLNSQLESDIDFFIITKPGRIWSARFFAILLTKLFGKRPSLKRTKDALCLSFFAIEGADLQRLSLCSRGSTSVNEDVYYKFWMTKLFPLFVRGNAGKQFWARNRWVRKELPQAELIYSPQCSSSTLSVGATLSVPLRLFGNSLDAVLRAVQMRLMPKHLKNIAKQGTAVVINNEFLKFHDHDQRAAIKKQFQARLAEIIA